MVTGSPDIPVARAAIQLLALAAGIAAALELLDASPPGEAARP